MRRWINAKKRLPKKSGQYLCIVWGSILSVLDFSQKYKLFNASDRIPKEVAEQTALDVTHWMSLPKLPKERYDYEQSAKTTNDEKSEEDSWL